MNRFIHRLATGSLVAAACLAGQAADAGTAVSWSIGIGVPAYPVGFGAVVSSGPVYAAPPVVVAAPALVYAAPVIYPGYAYGPRVPVYYRVGVAHRGHGWQRRGVRGHGEGR